MEFYAFKKDFHKTPALECSASWQVSFFMKEAAVAAFIACLLLKSGSCRGGDKQDMLTSYIQVLDYLMDTFDTDDIIVEEDRERVLFTSLTIVSGVECVIII